MIISQFHYSFYIYWLAPHFKEELFFLIDLHLYVFTDFFQWS